VPTSAIGFDDGRGLLNERYVRQAQSGTYGMVTDKKSDAETPLVTHVAVLPRRFLDTCRKHPVKTKVGHCGQARSSLFRMFGPAGPPQCRTLSNPYSPPDTLGF